MSDVYQVITDRIIQKLQQGVVPWKQAWNSETGVPKNLVSKKPYRGVNTFLLGCQRFSSPFWLTYNQAKVLGGGVKKGEQGTPVIFWKVGNKPGASDLDLKSGKGRYFLLRYYTSFNVSQCEGIEVPNTSEEKVFNPIQECEKVVDGYSVSVLHDERGYAGRACYVPSLDTVYMPKRESFDSSEEYYSVLYHEMTHSTGHVSRLGREGITNPSKFASHEYSFEELIAECGAAFLCGFTGIENKTLDNSAAYIQSWIAKLRNDPKWIVDAASKAARAVDLIRGVKPNQDEDE